MTEWPAAALWLAGLAGVVTSVMGGFKVADYFRGHGQALRTRVAAFAAVLAAMHVVFAGFALGWAVLAASRAAWGEFAAFGLLSIGLVALSTGEMFDVAPTFRQWRRGRAGRADG